MFELCEDLLDGIEVRAVGRQEQEAGTSGADCGPDGSVFMAGEIVHDDDVAGRERGTQLLLDPSREGCSVDRLIEDERSIDPVAAQGGDEGHRLPVAIRHLGIEPLADRRPTAKRCHVGLGPGLIDEDEAPGVRSGLILLPLLAPPGDLWAQLFGRQHAFF